MNLRTYFFLVIACVVVSISGCGSGNSGSNTTVSGSFVSKSSLEGTVPPEVKGIELTLVLPDSVTVQTDTNKQPLVTLLAPNNITATNGILYTTYTPDTHRLKLVLIRGDQPFSSGDFFSVTCTVDAGKTVTSANFTTEGLRVWDSTGADVTSILHATSGVSEVTVIQ